MARAKKPSTTSDLVRSLLVILVPVVLITYFFTRTPDAPPISVLDWQPPLAQARREAPYEVLAPAATPAGWRPTKAVWLAVGKPGLNGDPSPRSSWQLGFLTDHDVYLELDQGDLKSADLIAASTRNGLPDGQSPVGDQLWQRTESEDGRTHALVLASPSVTSVVAGDLPYADLEAFAALLRAG